MTTSKISWEKRGDHVVLIGINRPEKRNAFDLEMLHGLSEAYTRYEEDDSLRCAVLHAHGAHFTGGLDLAAVSPSFRTGDWNRPEGGLDPLDLGGRHRTKPLVCAVQGYCFTIGLELMLASDIRVAAADTQFAMLEVRRGIYPVGGATLRFPQEAGWSNAMRYLLTGDTFGAQDALRMNLVQEVAEPGTQLERAVALAETVARQAPLGVRAVLASSRMAMVDGEAQAAAQLLPLLQPILDSADAQEGVQSFLERREARFSGK